VLGNASVTNTYLASGAIDTNRLYIGHAAANSAYLTVGLTIDQGANDDEIFALKSSTDVAHGMTAVTGTDTFGTIKKVGATNGGMYLTGYSNAEIGMRLRGIAYNDDTGKATSANAYIEMNALKRASTSAGAVGSDGNLVVIQNDGTTRFIFDAEGSFHADVESTTFDSYNDAALVRAFDLSHGKGVIATQFDEFVDYNHETLADLKLVGRDEDGSPNKMVNVTKMQQLHNGAIWQQYTEMQKMKELMYETMVEMIGKDKADAKLKDHDIKLLDENTLLN